MQSNLSVIALLVLIGLAMVATGICMLAGPAWALIAVGLSLLAFAVRAMAGLDSDG